MSGDIQGVNTTIYSGAVSAKKSSNFTINPPSGKNRCVGMVFNGQATGSNMGTDYNWYRNLYQYDISSVDFAYVAKLLRMENLSQTFSRGSVLVPYESVTILAPVGGAVTGSITVSSCYYDYNGQYVTWSSSVISVKTYWI